MKCSPFVLRCVSVCLAICVLSACSDDNNGPVAEGDNGVLDESTGNGATPTAADDSVVDGANALAAAGGSIADDQDSPVEDESTDVGFDRPGFDVIVPPGTTDARSLGTPLRAETTLFQIPEVPAGLGEAFVFLSRFNEPQILANEIDFLAPELDTCRIRDLDAESQPPAPRSTLVSGGSSLVLTSPAGTWLTIPRISEGGRIFYQDENGLPSIMPDDTTMDILGDNFPALQRYPLFAPSVPERVSPTIGDALTSDTEYRWVAGDTTSYMVLDFRNYLDGEFRGFAANCTVADDGSFTLPEDVARELESLPGEYDVRYTRYADRLEFRDNIFLYTTSGMTERMSISSLVGDGSERSLATNTERQVAEGDGPFR